MIAQRSGTMGMPLSLWPFGGRDPFESMMADMHRMRSHPNAEVFSSSSVMTYSSTGDGSRPKIYQATTSTRRAPGQVKETRRSLYDSESGVKKMAVGHQLGERSHTIERSHNLLSGERVEKQDFVNLEEGT